MLGGRLTAGRVLELFGRPQVGPAPQPATHDGRVGEQERADGHAFGRVHAARVDGPEQRLQLPVVQPFEQCVAELPLVRLDGRMNGGGRRSRLLLLLRRRRM